MQSDRRLCSSFCYRHTWASGTAVISTAAKRMLWPTSTRLQRRPLIITSSAWNLQADSYPVSQIIYLVASLTTSRITVLHKHETACRSAHVHLSHEACSVPGQQV